MSLPSVFRTQTFPWAEEAATTTGAASSPLSLNQNLGGVRPGAIIDFNKSTQFSPFQSQYENSPWSIPQLRDYMGELSKSAWNEEGAKGYGSVGGSGSWGRASGSGIGLAAYGWTKGPTGQAAQKGTAKYGLQVPMWNALSAANAAMKKAGLGSFGITDGFRPLGAPGDGPGRNPYSQYGTKARKGNLAATPGRSIHGLGLAADLGLNAAQFKWLMANGARYGLVNLPSERWHWQLAPSVWAKAKTPAKKTASVSNNRQVLA